MPVDRKVLGHLLRVLRTAHGLSLRELAEMVDIDNSMLSMVETAKRTPSLDNLESLADGLEMPLWVLVALAEVDDPPEAARHIFADTILRVVSKASA